MMEAITTFQALLVTELRKLRRSLVLLPLAIAPAVVLLDLLSFLTRNSSVPAAAAWPVLLIGIGMFYGGLLMPLAIGAIAGLACRSEHLAGGWRQAALLPTPRALQYLAKLLVVLGLVALLQVVTFGLAALAGGLLMASGGAIPWQLILGRMVAGWLLSVPIAALQLCLAVRLESFGAQMAIAAMLTIPGLIALHTRYAHYYFWDQPALAMSGAVGGQVVTPLLVAASAALVLIVGGFLYFVRRDVA